MSKNRMAPPIRFQGFTESWEQRKLGEIAEYKKGPFGSALKKDFFIPDSATSVKVYEQQNAINKNWNLSRYYISKEYAQKLKSFEVHAGDIIVSCAGTIGEIYELPAQSRSGIINQALMRIRVNEDIVCKDIFKLAFSNMIDSFSREFSNGSAIKNIPPFADLKPMKILLPNKAEQTIIGDFFTNIDKTITLYQHKLEQQKKLKKYFLQNMFPAEGETVPRIRFKEFTGDWEQRKLGDCFWSLPNNTLSRAELSYENGVVMNVHYGDVLIKFDEYLDVSKERLPFIEKQSAAEKIKTSYLKNGDVIVADTAEDETVGKCTEIIGLTDQKVTSGLHTIPIRPKEQFATGYLGFYLNSAAYHNQLIPLIQGTKVSSISKGAMQKTVIKYPVNLEEQELIGQYFMKFDNLIVLHQRKIDQLQVMKKFMLQNLFV